MTEKDMTPREGAPPGPAPRSYSEFMRSLAAKYNGENPGEAPPPQDPRLQPKPAPLHFPQGGAPFPFPPFLFPPADGLKDPPFPFLPGLRPPLHPGLLEPAQAQALLTMMRAGVQHNPARPPQPLQPSEPPAKRARRGSSCVEEQPVSPPASRVPAAGLAAGCISLCSTSQACSEEGRALLAWDTEQVAEFVRSLPACREYAEVFLAENIDGGVLALLTDQHLLALGLKLGPALRLRAALAARLGNCPHCRHCKHCHSQGD